MIEAQPLDRPQATRQERGIERGHQGNRHRREEHGADLPRAHLHRQLGDVVHVGVEGDAGLIDGARANAVANRIGNAQFAVDNLFEPAGWGPWSRATYQCVLLDPPRAGAAEAMLHMSQWAPRRIVYISCHTGSLARDAGILTERQGYRLVAAGVMDMFPQTTHVESIAIFERSR